MSKKVKIIIIVSAAVILLGGIATGTYFGVIKPKLNAGDEKSVTEVNAENSENDNNDSTTKKEENDSFTIAYSDICYGVYSNDGADYICDLNGMYKQDSKGKKTQLTTGNFTIINDKIYYTVIDKKSQYNCDLGEYKWVACSAWVMNLDGSGQKKVIQYTGNGNVIYADEDNIYYADDLEHDIYTSVTGQIIYKYNKSTNKTVQIFKDNSQKYETGFVDITYASDNIFFVTCDDEGCGSNAFKYNIKNGQTVKLRSDCNNLKRKDDNSIILKNLNFNDSEDETQWETVVEYNVSSGTAKTVIKTEEFTAMSGNNAMCVKNNNYFTLILDNEYSNGFKKGIYDCTMNGKTEMQHELNSGDSIKSISSDGTKIYAVMSGENESQSSLICIDNGKTTVIKKCNDDLDMRSVSSGANNVVIAYYDYQGESFVENMYNKIDVIPVS